MSEEMFLKILDSREERSFRQKELIDEFNQTLISFTINAPGINKNRDSYNKIHKEGYHYIIDVLLNNNTKISYKEYLDKDTGNEAFIIVNRDSIDVKKITVKIEDNHILGRVFDIDVFDRDKTQLSRVNLGLSPRRCLICEENARVCIKEKKHSYEELINYVDTLWKVYIDNQ